MEIELEAIRVQFPFTPYQEQHRLMSVIVKAIQSVLVLMQGQNALVESPTGTGKTLCLLCATLAWRAAYLEWIKIARRLQHHSDVPDTHARDVFSQAFGPDTQFDPESSSSNQKTCRLLARVSTMHRARTRSCPKPWPSYRTPATSHLPVFLAAENSCARIQLSIAPRLHFEPHCASPRSPSPAVNITTHLNVWPLTSRSLSARS
jgi:hypothetical protein